MRNPDKPVRNIDDTPKSKNEIAEMISRMMETDENGYPEKEDTSKKTA